MQFKIYYDDGSTYVPEKEFFGTVPSTETPQGTFTPGTSPMPKRGVLAVVQRNPDTNWVALSGYDYYVWKGYWRGCDFFGMLEFLKDNGYVDYGIGWKKIHYKGEWIKADIIDFFAFIEEECPVLIGRWTLASEFASVLQHAEDDREFGVKNGYVKGERLPKPWEPGW